MLWVVLLASSPRGRNTTVPREKSGALSTIARMSLQAHIDSFSLARPHVESEFGGVRVVQRAGTRATMDCVSLAACTPVSIGLTVSAWVAVALNFNLLTMVASLWLSGC